MAYFTLDEARQAFNRRATKTAVRKSVEQIATEALLEGVHATSFDVFLSHSFEDKELILGVKQLIEDEGKTVYVDWIVDRHLNRKNVTKETADLLRDRMRQSTSLIYAATGNSSQSKWMPWELGWFDGSKPGQVAIMPLLTKPNETFNGQEYLGLYPVIEKRPDAERRPTAVVTQADGYRLLREFATGPGQFRRSK